MSDLRSSSSRRTVPSASDEQEKERKNLSARLSVCSLPSSLSPSPFYFGAHSSSKYREHRLYSAVEGGPKRTQVPISAPLPPSPFFTPNCGQQKQRSSRPRFPGEDCRRRNAVAHHAPSSFFFFFFFCRIGKRSTSKAPNPLQIGPPSARPEFFGSQGLRCARTLFSFFPPSSSFFLTSPEKLRLAVNDAAEGPLIRRMNGGWEDKAARRPLSLLFFFSFFFFSFLFSSYWHGGAGKIGKGIFGELYRYNEVLGATSFFSPLPLFWEYRMNCEFR